MSFFFFNLAGVSAEFVIFLDIRPNIYRILYYAEKLEMSLIQARNPLENTNERFKLNGIILS